MKKAASQRLLDSRLSRKIPSDQALTKVRTLYNLLPSGPGCRNLQDFATIPEEVAISGCVSTARTISLRNNFLKKFRGFTSYKPREAAVASFWKYEEHCRNSNIRLRAMRTGHFDDPLQAVLLTAQRKIARVLRDFDIDELLDSARWGPGTTSSCKGPRVTATEKFSSRPDVTREFLIRARHLMPRLPSWSALLADQDYGVTVCPVMPLIRGNKVTFVPKTAKTHRGIAVEPHVNVFFQNGLGRMIRKRLLLRAQVNLNDQTLNQRLARLGSNDDSLATIDLEGASDTLCLELVRDLLPEDWFNWLDAARSHFGQLDGSHFRYHKFSSMGNGATFDLESLIFWAISSAVVELNGYNPFWVNVFGDDIVVPSGCYDAVVQALNGAGFIVNRLKSFSSGPFRESCGFDFYLGSNVRPVYLKEIPSRPIDWIVIANQLRTLSHRWGENVGCSASLRQAWEYALSQVPKDCRYFVPYGYHLKRGTYGGFEGNGILSNFDEAVPSTVRHRGRLTTFPGPADDGWEGYLVRAIFTKARTYNNDSRQRLTAAVSYPTQFGNNLPYRDQVYYREDTLFVPTSWYNLGPWF